MSRKRLVGLILLLSILLVACQPTAPQVESDSGHDYKTSLSGNSSRIPLDLGAYVFTGTIEPQQIVVDYVGLVEVPITSPDFLDKSQLLLKVEEAEYIENDQYDELSFVGSGNTKQLIFEAYPDADDLFEGQIVILKVTDAKALALRIGDKVTFKCRVQYEAVGASADNEVLNRNLAETLEIDWCRMEDPIITLEKGR